MSVTKVKDRWRFEFSQGRGASRQRVTKLLPKGWTASQAKAFDIKETARLFSIVHGEKPEPLIEDAVLLYIKEHCPTLKHGDQYVNQLAVDLPHYEGKTFSQLNDVASEIQKENVSAATKRNRIAYIRAACNFAYKRGMGTYRPSDRLQLSQVKNERHVECGRKEALQIARKAIRRDVRAAIMIAYYSGMRQGEIRRCSVSDGKFVVRDTKNGSAVHIVPVHPKLRVYTKRIPMNIPRVTLARAFERYREAAGLKHIHFHDLRHAAASALVNKGVDLYVVGKILGHKDSRSTQRYAHLQTDVLQDAINKI